MRTSNFLVPQRLHGSSVLGGAFDNRQRICSLSIWIASRSSRDRSDDIHRAIRSADNSTNRRETADLDRLSTRLDHLGSIAVTKAELAAMQTDIIKWVFTIALGQGALIVALIKLLPGGHP